MKLDEWQAIEKRAVWIIPYDKYRFPNSGFAEGILGIAVSKKMLHSRWLYTIFTDAGWNGAYLAYENELMFLE